MKPTNHVRNSFDDRANQALHLQPIYNICSVSNVHEYQESEGYECMIHVGGTEFVPNLRENRRPSDDITAAENVAARNAYTQMQKMRWILDSEKDLSKQKLIQDNVYKVSGGKTTKEGWQSLVYMGKDELSAIYECDKYMSDEVLAMQFKDIVRLVTTNIIYPKFNSTHVTEYTTRYCVDGPFRGYKSTLDFNGRKFDSLGLMMDENQAEQSASEHALRTLGFLPKSLKKAYLIQPYLGGVPKLLPGIKVHGAFVFTGTILYDILEAFMDSRFMMRPKYFIKDTSKGNTTEFSIHGEPDPLVECVCSLNGRFFRAPSANTRNVAVQLSANEALQHFRLDRVRERMELRKYIRLNRFEFSKGAKTVYSSRPSVSRGWIWPRFCKVQQYKDVMVVGDFLNSDVLLHNWPCTEYINTLVKKELGTTPTFKGNKLTRVEHVSVAEVDKNNPDLFIIGTSEFSIKMLAKEGKIYSRQRECNVDIKPGHNIRKLKCEYRVSLPSLEVHLKAIDCSDVYYSNPPLPVVTSCGVVALFHDYLASPEDVYVLLTRNTIGTTFEPSAPRLQCLLHSMITASTLDIVTPAVCTEGIEKWLDKEVKLLSEMTMDSLHALMSTFTKYDTRWNELFVADELPPALKLIQETCLTELKRREENGISVVEEQEFWDLPHSDFVTRFDPIGIHIEDSTFCGIRSFADTAGLRLRLNDIQGCSSVDIPIENDKSHRGGVSRYYIWNGFGEENKLGFVHQRNESPEEKELLKDYLLLKNPKTEHGMRRYRYAFHERTYMYGSIEEQQHLMRNIEYVNADGSRTKYIDFIKYRINDKELRRSKQLTKVQDNEQTPGGKDDTSENRLGAQHLPGGDKWSSYKASLQLHCKMQKLPAPYYIIKQVGTMYRGEVCIGKTKIVGRRNSVNRDMAGASAAYTALRQYDYLKGVNFEYGIALLRRKNKRLEAEAAIKQLVEKTKGGAAKESGKTSGEKETSDSGGAAKESGKTSGEQETSEPVDNEGEEEETSVMKCEDSAENGREEHEEETMLGILHADEIKREELDSEFADGEEYKVVNEWTKSEDAADESFTVVNEWLRDDDIKLESDEEDGRERHRHGRKRRYQWVDEEDIPADELDTGKRQKDDDMRSKKKKTRKRSPGGKHQEKEGGTPVEARRGKHQEKKGGTPVGTPRGKHQEKQGGTPVESPREKNQQKQGGTPTHTPKKDNVQPKKHTPDMKKVIYQTPEGTKTVWKRERIPPLPARDAYRIQCLWMKLDDAMNVCPMLQKVSQTSQFKGRINELIETANGFMKSRNLGKTVTTTCALDP